MHTHPGWCKIVANTTIYLVKINHCKEVGAQRKSTFRHPFPVINQTVHQKEVIILEIGDRAIGRWVSLLYRHGQCYLDRELGPFNIGSGQFMFLAALLREDGIRQESLSNILDIDKGTTAKALKKLEEQGYITRLRDPCDKRANKVYVTGKALEIKPLLIQIAINWTNALTTGFSPDEKDKTFELLKRMSENSALFIKETKQFDSKIAEDRNGLQK